jgi:hypothetical protein
MMEYPISQASFAVAYRSAREVVQTGEKTSKMVCSVTEIA